MEVPVAGKVVEVLFGVLEVVHIEGVVNIQFLLQ